MPKFQGSERAKKLRKARLLMERKVKRMGEATGTKSSVPAMIAAEPIQRSYLKRIGTQERAEQPELSRWAETNPPVHKETGKTLAERLRQRREEPVPREMPGRKVSFKPRAPGTQPQVEDVISPISAKFGHYYPGNKEGIQEAMYHRENPFGTHPTRAMLAEAGVADTENPLKDVDPETGAEAAKSFLKYDVKDPQKSAEVEEFARMHPELMKEFLYDNFISKPGKMAKDRSNTGLSHYRGANTEETDGADDSVSAEGIRSIKEGRLSDPNQTSIMHAAIPGPEEVMERQQEASPLVRKASLRDAPPDLMARKVQAVAEIMARRDAQVERNKAAAPTVPGISRMHREGPKGVRGGKKKYVGPGRFTGEVSAFPEADIHELAGASKPNPERRKYSKSLKRIKKGPRGTDVAREGGDPTDYREGWQKLSAMLRNRKRMPSERNPIPGLGE